MKEYSIYNHPTRMTGYWVQACGYAYWHRNRDAAERHAASIRWTDQVSVWSCATGEVI